MKNVILASDTATPAVTAGIVRRDGDSIDVLAERVTVDARAHAEQLTPNVLAALAEGRVARLLLASSKPFPGTVGPGETLSAAVDPGNATDLTDWIVVSALATDAAVTPVSGEAAAVLESRGGLGALLRW